MEDEMSESKLHGVFTTGVIGAVIEVDDDGNLAITALGTRSFQVCHGEKDELILVLEKPTKEAKPLIRRVDSPAARVPQIGIFRGGKTVGEFILDRETVTVGPGASNRVVVQEATLPDGFPLLELRGDVYRLNLLEGMSGTVAPMGQGSGLSVAALRQAGTRLMATAGDPRYGARSVPVNDAGRGKVVVGETTIMFQFVSPPPARGRA